jgi:hypothetical protein
MIDEFVISLGSFNTTGMPAIHIPIIGKSYEKSAIKIAFFGKETYGWHSFQEFMELFAGNGKEYGSTVKAYDYLVNSTKPTDYLKWTNNWGTSFWDYIFQFLTTFYKLDPNLLENEGYKNLLDSFIWGNTNSMERYSVTAEGQGAEYSDWEHIKNASKIFDKAKYVLNLCKPDIMLVMDWEADEKWLIGKVDKKHEEIYDHHWFYKMGRTNVYWLAHPRWIAPNIGFSESINIIIKDLEKRGIKTGSIKAGDVKAGDIIFYNGLPLKVAGIEYK